VKAIDLYFIIQKYAQKISKYYKKKGLWRTILRSLVWVLYQKEDFLFFEIDLTTLPSNLETRDNLSFSALTMEEVQEIPDYFDGWFTKRQALERLEKGARLFAVRKQEKPVSLLWVESHRAYIPPLGLIFIMPDTTAYIAYTYTLPEHRQGGIGSWMHYCVMEYLKSHDYHTALGLVSLVNEAALKIGKGSGFTMFQAVFYKKFVLFFKYYRVRNPDTGHEKIFWRIRKTDHQIWRTFSSSHRV
jgi:hypothetical protein